MSAIQVLIKDYETDGGENEEVIAGALLVIMNIPAVCVSLSALTDKEVEVLDAAIKNVIRRVRESHKWDNYITPYD